MAKIIQFPGTILERAASQNPPKGYYISKDGRFDYTELNALVDAAEATNEGNGIKFWRDAIGMTWFQLLQRLWGEVAFKASEIDRLISFLGIPDAEVSRVFFKAV